METIKLVNVPTTAYRTGGLALVGKEGSAISYLAGALGFGLQRRIYGYEEIVNADLGDWEWTSGTANGTSYFTSSVTKRRFVWNYRSGWVGPMPTRADFGIAED